MQLFVLLSVLALSYSAAFAQNRNVRIDFPSNTSEATKSGVIKGYETVTYTFRVMKGQSVRVKLTSRNPVYFSAGGIGRAMRSWESNVRKNGDFTITVFLFRNAARRGAPANYSLNVRAGWITP